MRFYQYMDSHYENNVIITSKRRRDVILTLLLRRVPTGVVPSGIHVWACDNGLGIQQTLKRQGSHVDNFVVTVCTWVGHHDHLKCSYAVTTFRCSEIHIEYVYWVE